MCCWQCSGLRYVSLGLGAARCFWARRKSRALSHATTYIDSGDRQRICCDFGRWFSGHLGRSTVWRWQFCGSRSAQGCATDSGDRRGICCDFGRWFSGHLGWWRFWRWQLSSSMNSVVLSLGVCVCVCVCAGCLAEIRQMGIFTRIGLYQKNKSRSSINRWDCSRFLLAEALVPKFKKGAT